MLENYRNIYKTARQSAGLTQEAAAERLDISVESIRAYETAQRIPPNHVVEAMIEVYNAQHLAYQHLKETNALAGRIIPTVEERSLVEIALRVHNRLTHFANSHSVDRLMEIAEDGVIDETERADFETIVKDLKELVQCGFELSMYHEKGVNQ